MTAPRDDGLRESLRELADEVAPADMYDRVVHRSRRIARREAAVGTVAALAALGLLASGLWRLPAGDDPHRSPLALVSSSSPTREPAPEPMPSATPPAAASGQYAGRLSTTPARRKNRPQVSASTATPQSRALRDLPGHVFYQESGSRPDVVRLSPADGGAKTVLADAPSPVGISPDGDRIAYALDGALLIGETGSPETEQVATGVSTAAQAPVWSPAGDRLLVDANSPAILQVESGVLTPLAGALAAGQHLRWSGDGLKLVYATAYCSLKVTADGSDAVVPVFGDRQPVDNPDGLAACKLTSVDSTGSHVTVPLQTTGDIGTASPDTADAVVDTITGDLMALPVAGSVVGAVFDPDGNLLVRTRASGRTTLSLFSVTGDLRVQAAEPAAVRDLDLLAYTR
ncbi:TolB family protein [Paractinoplanes durhamensis]|uniref:TolB protein n=1 Tax=Paractinoplanes durhamensis TaxID=113563 RepID=A0ABQ3ZBL8_9ACTN|nr:hypothetical protein [Actinoplanes durhamensis]GIE07207.1 hypothetical protein Adu01nite_85570 [Actinoplanes durhamensis]